MLNIIFLRQLLVELVCSDCLKAYSNIITASEKMAHQWQLMKENINKEILSAKNEIKNLDEMMSKTYIKVAEIQKSPHARSIPMDTIKSQ